MAADHAVTNDVIRLSELWFPPNLRVETDTIDELAELRQSSAARPSRVHYERYSHARCRAFDLGNPYTMFLIKSMTGTGKTHQMLEAISRYLATLSPQQRSEARIVSVTALRAVAMTHKKFFEKLNQRYPEIKMECYLDEPTKKRTAKAKAKPGTRPKTKRKTKNQCAHPNRMNSPQPIDGSQTTLPHSLWQIQEQPNNEGARTVADTSYANAAIMQSGEDGGANLSANAVSDNNDIGATTDTDLRQVTIHTMLNTDAGLRFESKDAVNVDDVRAEAGAAASSSRHDQIYRQRNTIISLDSLHHLESSEHNKRLQPPTILILDEITALSTYLVMNNKTFIRSVRQRTWDILCELIRSSTFVVAMDKSLDSPTVEALAKIRSLREGDAGAGDTDRAQTVVYHNTYKSNTKRYVHAPSMRYGRLKLFEFVRRGLNVDVVCDSKQETIRLHDALLRRFPSLRRRGAPEGSAEPDGPDSFRGRHRKSRVLLLNADTEEAQKLHDLCECETEWVKYQVVIRSPTVLEGLNFDPCSPGTDGAGAPKPHFHKIMVFLCGQSIDAHQAFQAMERTRHVIDQDDNVYLCYQQKAFGVPNWIPRDKWEKSQFHIHVRFVNDFFDNSNVPQHEREREARFGEQSALQRERRKLFPRGDCSATSMLKFKWQVVSSNGPNSAPAGRIRVLDTDDAFVKIWINAHHRQREAKCAFFKTLLQQIYNSLSDRPGEEGGIRLESPSAILEAARGSELVEVDTVVSQVQQDHKQRTANAVTENAVGVFKSALLASETEVQNPSESGESAESPESLVSNSSAVERPLPDAVLNELRENGLEHELIEARPEQHRTITELFGPQVWPPIQKMTQDPNPAVQKQALETIRRLSDPAMQRKIRFFYDHMGTLPGDRAMMMLRQTHQPADEKRANAVSMADEKIANTDEKHANSAAATDNKDTNDGVFTMDEKHATTDEKSVNTHEKDATSAATTSDNDANDGMDEKHASSTVTTSDKDANDGMDEKHATTDIHTSRSEEQSMARC